MAAAFVWTTQLLTVPMLLPLENTWVIVDRVETPIMEAVVVEEEEEVEAVIVITVTPAATAIVILTVEVIVTGNETHMDGTVEIGGIVAARPFTRWKIFARLSASQELLKKSTAW